MLPLRKTVQRGEIPALHPLKDGPWIFQQRDLETEKTKWPSKTSNNAADGVDYRTINLQVFSNQAHDLMR
jgi:hypothetical protein